MGLDERDNVDKLFFKLLKSGYTCNRSSRYKDLHIMSTKNNDLITTTLSAAIDLVTALELREEKAFPKNQRDPSVINERGADPGYHTREAKSTGYTGPEIRGPSSSWVKLAEGENVLPPLTPGVTQMNCGPGMRALAMFARFQRTEQRKKYRIGWLG